MIRLALILLSFLLAFLGYKKNVVDRSSLIFVLVFSVYFILLFPIYFFLSLLILYLLTSFATKYKSDFKKVRHRKGRSITNLLSNLLIPITFSFLYLIFCKNMIFYFAFLTSVACACADTLASEVGQLSKKNPRLITTLEEVKTGTEGGISLLGLAFGLVGSLAVAFPSFFYFGIYKFSVASFIGFVGCNIDSFIGAQFELKGKCTNETTNLVATLSAGLLGLLIFAFLI
jgi:uncharacterized protein (TIGR00297 family)